jgi:hypothetical protein
LLLLASVQISFCEPAWISLLAAVLHSAWTPWPPCKISDISTVIQQQTLRIVTDDELQFTTMFGTCSSAEEGREREK